MSDMVERDLADMRLMLENTCGCLFDSETWEAFDRLKAKLIDAALKADK